MTETRLKGNKLSSGYSGNKNNIRSLYYNDNKILTRIIQAENDIESLKPTDTIMSHQTVSSYYVNTWQMGMNM